MRYHLVAVNCVIHPSDRKRITGARSRQRLKTEMSQYSSRSNIPGIRNDECAISLMDRAKCVSLFSLSQHLAFRNAGLTWGCSITPEQRSAALSYTYAALYRTKNETEL